MFSCEIYENVRNTYFEEHLWKTASGISGALRNFFFFFEEPRLIFRKRSRKQMDVPRKLDVAKCSWKVDSILATLNLDCLSSGKVVQKHLEIVKTILIYLVKLLIYWFFYWQYARERNTIFKIFFRNLILILNLFVREDAYLIPWVFLSFLIGNFFRK